MLSFECDYNVGAHLLILQRLIETNLEAQPGYGEDAYTASAKAKIKAACGRDHLDVHFLAGGTQTNKIVIDSMLHPVEGVIAATTGHVAAHEAGAIEASGHKVLTVPGHEGKVYADEVEVLIKAFYNDASYTHMVFPGMVYISHPTEYGTLYTKDELSAISAVCRKYEIPLFLDGARLGYGLMSEGTDVTLGDLCDLCDVFYIGGTKVGALCGEAVVFTHNNTPAHFFTFIKQNGALLAKGRLIGVQFDVLFTDDLYFRLGKNAIDMAAELRRICAEKGYKTYLDSPTNQQFFILENEKCESLAKHVRFSEWEKPDDAHTVIRLATSWATTKEDLAALAEVL
ncbi:MAG: low specificity L-threonine aldolase [Clostridia bacterium]|nr:low specificity L-threonine aldolase [Clostridia bacterium]